MSHRMTKPTKWPLRPAKTQISLCIRPIWSESSLSAWTNTGSPATHWAHYEDWSDWADAQADLSLRWAQGPFCWFCHEVAHIQKVLVASEINHIFLSPCSVALWLQGQGSLVRAPALPHTGYTYNLHRISHEIMYMVFLLFPLIQERQFLFICESIRTLNHFVLVNCLEGLSISARRSGLGRSFNCILGFIDRESANQIYWYMRGIVVTLSRSLHKFRWCWGGAISLSHTNLPTLIHALQYLSNVMKSQYNLITYSRDEFWSVPGNEMMHSGDAFKCTIPRSGSHSRPLYDWNTVATFCTVDWNKNKN